MNKSCTKCQNASVRVPNKRDGPFNSENPKHSCVEKAKMKFVATTAAAVAALL